MLGTVEHDGLRFPLLAVVLGNPDPTVPAAGIFGGVHGLERIGTEVALAALRQFVARLRWDATLHHLLDGLRLVVMPLVNPGGLWLGTRANPQGVDLMRNAPVQATEPVPMLLGGHRIGGWLPWYRGPADAPMQAEAQALCTLVAEELLTHRFAISVDCHSGFGVVDRLWFPYAHTARPVPMLPEVLALAQQAGLFCSTLSGFALFLRTQCRGQRVIGIRQHDGFFGRSGLCIFQALGQQFRCTHRIGHRQVHLSQQNLGVSAQFGLCRQLRIDPLVQRFEQGLDAD